MKIVLVKIRLESAYVEQISVKITFDITCLDDFAPIILLIVTNRSYFDEWFNPRLSSKSESL